MGKSLWYPLDRKLGGHQDWSGSDGEAHKPPVPAANRTLVVQSGPAAKLEIQKSGTNFIVPFQSLLEGLDIVPFIFCSFRSIFCHTSVCQRCNILGCCTWQGKAGGQEEGGVGIRRSFLPAKQEGCVIKLLSDVALGGGLSLVSVASYQL
jgi:hypothetical protein